MIIYKYLPCDGIKALQNGSVLLGNPTTFNDPFDCVFYVNKREKQQAFKLYLNYYLFKEMYKTFYVDKKEPVRWKNYANILKANIGQLEEQVRKTKRYKYQLDINLYKILALMVTKVDIAAIENEFNKMIDDTMLEVRKSALVSCFGLNNKSILMWSHYAEKHKGICLEYEVPDNSEFKFVKYKRREPVFKLRKLMEYIFGHDFAEEKINTKEDLYSFALVPLLTKYKDWKYEKEVRCVLPSNATDEKVWKDGDKFLLKMPKPKRIFVGCNADEIFIENVKAKAGDIPVFFMKMIDGKYAIKEKEEY